MIGILLVEFVRLTIIGSFCAALFMCAVLIMGA